MGNDRSNFRIGPQQSGDSRLYVLHPPKHYDLATPKQPKKTMEAKLLMTVFTLIASSGYGLIILLNIDNVKGLILFVIACLYGIARLIFYCIKQNQERRMRELDLIERERHLRHGSGTI